MTTGMSTKSCSRVSVLILPEGQEVPVRWENTALTVIDHPAPWRVRLLNCIAHLDDLATRPLSEPAPPEYTRLRERPTTTHLRLEPLSAGAFHLSDYVRYIQEVLATQICLVSVGPEREQAIRLKHII